MLEELFIWCLVGVCAFLLGKRFYRQLRAALGNNQHLSCGQGCCSCSSQTTCLPQSDLLEQRHREKK